MYSHALVRLMGIHKLSHDTPLSKKAKPGEIRYTKSVHLHICLCVGG